LCFCLLCLCPEAQDRKVTATQTPQKTLVTQDKDKEDKSTRQKSNSNTDPTKNLGVLLSSLSSSCVTKVFCGVCVAVTFLSCAFIPKKTLVTQDEDKEDKSTRQKSISNTDPTKNLGYTGRRQRRQKHKTEK
jgi:hypothetical protein